MDEQTSTQGDNDSIVYNKGWNDGYQAGIDESKATIDGAYLDGFDAGHAAGYQDAEGEARAQSKRKPPPDFSEPFGFESIED